MLKSIISTIAQLLATKGNDDTQEAPRGKKHSVVFIRVNDTEKTVKVGYLLSKLIDGLVALPFARISPSCDELTNNVFDANTYVREAQKALERAILAAEDRIGGKIVPAIVAEDQSTGTIIVPYVTASTFRDGLQAHCVHKFGAPLNENAMACIAKTCAYLSTPVYADQTFTRTVMVIPNDWLLHKAIMDGVGYVRAQGNTYVDHPRFGTVYDNDVCQVRGLVNVPSNMGDRLFIYKGTIVPIRLSQISGIWKRECLDAVNEALDKGYVIVTADTVKKAPVGTYADTCFYLHDSSSMTEQWTSLKSLSLQAAMKLSWDDTAGYDRQVFQQVLEYCAALDNDRALVEDIAGKLDSIDKNEDLPVEELTNALDQIRVGGLAPYDRINIAALLVKIMTTKRLKQVAEIKEMGMRLYVVANNDVPRDCVRIGKTNYWRMKSAWKSDVAVAARPPYTTTSVNCCRVICADHDNPTAEINPLDAGMFSADFDGDKITLTEHHAGMSFVNLGQMIQDIPLPRNISREDLVKYCPTIPAQYGTKNETAATLYALSVGNRVDVGDALVLGLIARFEEKGYSAVNARRVAYEVERDLFESLIDCRKHVGPDSTVPNIAAISLIQLREKLYAPRIYRLLSGKLDFSDISVTDLPKAIHEELEDSPKTKNPILEAAREYLLDFLPERCIYTFDRVNCDKTKSLIREMQIDYGALIKELQFSIKDNSKAMSIQNAVLDEYLALCKNKQFDAAAAYMNDVITPWIVEHTKAKDIQAVAIWFIIAAFTIKNRAAAGHMRWGFILKHVPSIIVRTVVETTYDRTELSENEWTLIQRKIETPVLSILARQQ